MGKDHDLTSDEFAHWHLPDVSADMPDSPDNLFGRKNAPIPPSASEDESVAPPTMAQIEDIRAEAEAEGFEQGKQQGHQEGLETGRLEGLEQGHLQGLEQGQQQGYEQGITEAKAHIQQLSSLIEQFQLPLKILDSQIEHELLALVTSLTKAITCHELHTHPELILAALRQGVDSLPIKEQQIKLRLSPKDAQLVEELYTPEQLARNQWQVEIDPVLQDGDCVIDSARSQVDMLLDTRMQTVLEQVVRQQEQLQHQIHNQQTELDSQSRSTGTPTPETQTPGAEPMAESPNDSNKGD